MDSVRRISEITEVDQGYKVTEAFLGDSEITFVT